MKVTKFSEYEEKEMILKYIPEIILLVLWIQHFC